MRVTAVIVPCPICGASFRTRAGMKIHFVASHPDYTVGFLPPKEAWEPVCACVSPTIGAIALVCSTCGNPFRGAV